MPHLFSSFFFSIPGSSGAPLRLGYISCYVYSYHLDTFHDSLSPFFVTSAASRLFFLFFFFFFLFFFLLPLPQRTTLLSRTFSPFPFPHMVSLQCVRDSILSYLCIYIALTFGNLSLVPLLLDKIFAIGLTNLLFVRSREKDRALKVRGRGGDFD